MLTAEYDKKREFEKLENTIRIYAEKRGWEKGHEEGLEKGREEGLEEGREEGREELKDEVLHLLSSKGVAPDIIKDIKELR